MIYRFIGKDSLGYIHGELYDIEIVTRLGYVCVKCKGHTICPYESIATLNANWVKF